MDLRHLETFIKIAELRSFTRTAETLFLTQPAVTRQIAALERDLHTRLLERMGKRVDLTPAGEALHQYAVQIIRLEEEAYRAVADVTSGNAGRLAVGASSTAATYILPPLLYAYREAFPEVELSVATGVSSQIAERVVANTVDVGVVTGLQGTWEELKVIPLADYVTVTVIYPGHPLARYGEMGNEGAGGVHPKDVAEYDLVLMQRGTNLREYVEELLTGVQAEPRVAMEMDNVEAIKKMIEAKLGISLLPLVSVMAEVSSGQLIALPLKEVSDRHRQIAVIHRKDKYITASLKALLELLHRGG